MFHDAEAREVRALDELAQREPALRPEAVEEVPTGGIGEGFEDRVHGFLYVTLYSRDNEVT